MTLRTIPHNFAVVILQTNQVIAGGLTKWQAKRKCRAWNRNATVETWASYTTRQTSTTASERTVNP